MSRGFSANRMSAALAIAACPIALATAAETIRADGPSAQGLGAPFGAAGSNKSHEARPHEVEDGSVADAVKAAKPAVFSVRVRYRAAAGERGTGARLDQSGNLLRKSLPETRPRVRTSRPDEAQIRQHATLHCRSGRPSVTAPPPARHAVFLLDERRSRI